MISLPLSSANSTCLASSPDDCVDAGIDQQNKQGKQVLDAGRQSGRVDQWCKIVFDKACLTAVGNGRVAQLVLKRRQWADPAKQFDQDAPCNTGEMQPCKPVQAQYQQAAGDNKQDKRGMQNKDQVGQEVDGQSSLPCLPNENLSIR